ncbi:TM2 domain-containing protein [Dokdonia sinensis]|uniref:TM2 domain-containing protein n=1 Tax=Dokdonia sinensis TaxID=2479847 RepID=A0A3M0GQK3_9FLAO|nr:TM2 domain-containing protein [Dokdonia sinensis]RMB63469.1 TM2 domain-containing protein [Dokdonia sinensis]
MKLKITLLFALLLLVSSNMYAGFPVTRVVATTVETVSETATVDITSPAATELDRQTTAIILWALLGGLAIHRFYLGSPILWNILFILTFGFFFVGWVIDGVEIITGTYPGL